MVNISVYSLHQHAYFSIIAVIFGKYFGKPDFLKFFYGSGFWNFSYLLWIFKVFIHVAPHDPIRGVCGGGMGTGGYHQGVMYDIIMYGNHD